jgi:hypothetical protein
MKRISTLVGVVAVLALAIPSLAMAASSTCQAYGPQTCSSVSNGNASTGNGSGSTGSSPGTVSSASSPGTVSSATATSAGTLPFTGLDVVLLVAGGGTLLAAGFVVRRLSRRLDN